MSLFFLIYRYMFGGAIHIAGMSLRRLSRPRVHHHRRAVHRDRDRHRDGRRPRAGVCRPAAVAADPAELRPDRARHRRHGDPARGAPRSPPRSRSRSGSRLHGTAAQGLAAFGLVVLFGFAFEWVFITMGLFAGNAQAAQGMGMIVFPFAFVSSAYVPVSSMPELAPGVRQAPAADVHGRRRPRR